MKTGYRITSSASEEEVRKLFLEHYEKVGFSVFGSDAGRIRELTEYRDMAAACLHELIDAANDGITLSDQMIIPPHLRQFYFQYREQLFEAVLSYKDNVKLSEEWDEIFYGGIFNDAGQARAALETITEEDIQGIAHRFAFMKAEEWGLLNWEEERHYGTKKVEKLVWEPHLVDVEARIPVYDTDSNFLNAKNLNAYAGITKVNGKMGQTLARASSDGGNVSSSSQPTEAWYNTVVTIGKNAKLETTDGEMNIHSEDTASAESTAQGSSVGIAMNFNTMMGRNDIHQNNNLDINAGARLVAKGAMNLNVKQNTHSHAETVNNSASVIAGGEAQAYNNITRAARVNIGKDASLETLSYTTKISNSLFGRTLYTITVPWR